MSQKSVAGIMQDNEAARQHRHPQRAMRVVLECAHMRLMSWNVTVTGIGSHTMCPICPDKPTRQVVDIQETGVLSDWYFRSHDDSI